MKKHLFRAEGEVDIDPEAPGDLEPPDEAPAPDDVVEPATPETTDDDSDDEVKEPDATRESPKSSKPEKPEEKPAEPASPETVAAGQERHEVEPPRTLAELLDQWRTQTRELEAGDPWREQLGYSATMITLALARAELQADEVYLAEAEAGVLGFYVPKENRIYVTTGFFALEPHDFAHVLRHEWWHRKGVADESLAETLTVDELGRMPGVYEGEQERLARTFDDLAEVEKLYDFGKPEELAEWFFRGQAEKIMDERMRGVYERYRRLPKKDRQRACYEVALGEKEDSLEERFKKALPRLHERLEAHGFNAPEVLKDVFKKAFAEHEKEHAPKKKSRR